MSDCTHVQPNYVKDIVLILLVVVVILVLREGLAWLLKTNHTQSIAQGNAERLDTILDTLRRNGIN